MRQGQYDALCGVYSIVNGVGALAKIAETDQARRKAIFDAICHRLNTDRLLLSAVTGGVSAGDYDGFIQRALKAVERETGIGVDVTTPFRRGQLEADAFYLALAEHIRPAGQSVAIAWISDGWDHWTVIRSISAARINLIDSDGRDHLTRRSCSVYPDKSAAYVLRPRQIYVLTRRQNGSETTR